jgi:hypothetical protein
MASYNIVKVSYIILKLPVTVSTADAHYFLFLYLNNTVILFY